MPSELPRRHVTKLMCYTISMKVAAAYFRCSTLEQELDRQISKVRSFAQTHEYTIVKEFFDKESGTNPDREQFLELQQWVADNEGSTVLVAELDRLSRGLEGYVAIKSACESHRVTLRALNVPTTGSVEADEFIEGILASFAKYERSLIVGRMFGGRLSKLRSGKAIMGRVAYGFLYVKNKRNQEGKVIEDARIEIHPIEAPILKEIFHLYTDQDWSLNKIASYLTKKKIPTKMGNEIWSSVTLKDILKNRAYIGEVYFQKNKFQRLYRGEFKHHKEKRPKEDWIKLSTPSLIDAELFEKTQILLQRPKHSVHNRKYDYLLTGIVYCGKCQRRYTGAMAGNGVKFYRCSSRYHLKSDGNSDHCRNPVANADRLDPYIWKWVKSLYDNPTAIIEKFVSKKESLAKTAEYLGDQASSINDKLNKLYQSDDRLIEAYTKGVLSLTEIQNQKDKIETEKVELIKQLKTYSEEVKAINQEMKIEDIVSFLKKEKEQLIDFDNMELAKKQEVVKKLIKRIVVQGERGKFTLEFMLPSMKTEDFDVAKMVGLHSDRIRSPYTLHVQHFVIPTKKYTRTYPSSYIDSIVSKDVTRHYERW